MDDSEQGLRNRAIGLLARREHSRRELRGKLQRGDVNSEQVESVIEQLCREGLQNDRRYAEVLIRSLINKGQGPLRIRQNLRQQEIDPEVVSGALAEAEVDWFERAAEVHRKRFGDDVSDTPKERARQIRFLLYRGFSQDQVNHALEKARQRAGCGA